MTFKTCKHIQKRTEYKQKSLQTQAEPKLGFDKSLFELVC